MVQCGPSDVVCTSKKPFYTQKCEQPSIPCHSLIVEAICEQYRVEFLRILPTYTFCPCRKFFYVQTTSFAPHAARHPDFISHSTEGPGSNTCCWTTIQDQRHKGQASELLLHRSHPNDTHKQHYRCRWWVTTF